LLELLVVIAIIIIIAALLLPALAKTKAKANRIQCLNNLKQAGVAFQIFAHDHVDKFPMQVSTNQGGSLEYNTAASNVAGLFYFAFRNFQVLSNELVTPKLLVCRADVRPVATNFVMLRDLNVSYFAGIKADPGSPSSFLAGDWNLTNSDPRTNTEFQFAWTKQVHEERGNILFADGRVELVKSFSVSRPGGPVPGGPVPSLQQQRPSARRDGSLTRPTDGSGPARSSTATSSQTGAGRTVRTSEAAAVEHAINVATTNAPVLTKVDDAQVEARDTENFRLVMAVAEAGYFLLLLLAILLLVMHFSKKRRRRAEQTE
jgi:prepilin-type processing-associated H-X9-DG protein